MSASGYVMFACGLLVGWGISLSLVGRITKKIVEEIRADWTDGDDDSDDDGEPEPVIENENVRALIQKQKRHA